MIQKHSCWPVPWFVILCLVLGACSSDELESATNTAVDTQVIEDTGQGESDASTQSDVDPGSDEDTAGAQVDNGMARLEAFCPGDAVAVEARIDELITELTVEEKAALMVGTEGFPADGVYPAGVNERLGIPGLRMVDGPRGVSKNTGNATVFPVAMARAATWEPALEYEVAEVMAVEAAARGANVLLAPTINILRHPRWGRAQETYGEDPVQLTAFGVAFVNGLQSKGVMASAKHYAANSIEDTRFDVDVMLDERTLREIYLPHFEAVVKDANIVSLMTSYNSVNGDFCSENEQLMSILKDEWGFLGFVESDWIFGTHDTVKAANAGLDIEMPIPAIFGNALVKAVEDGSVSIDALDAAARRIIRPQLCYGLDTNPKQKDDTKIETASHLELARRVSTQAMVLLKNTDQTLPLSAELTDVVLVGPFADESNLGDTGSSDVKATDPVTPYDGLVALLGESQVLLVDEPSSEESSAALASASTIIAVLGLSAEDEGESLLSAGDRKAMGLPQEQLDLLQSLGQYDAPVVVVLFGGSAVTVEEWHDEVDAILMAWYPGAQGGHALSDILLGVEAPGGGMPMVVPRSEEDLPPFDNVSLAVTYDYWHGYRHLDREGVAPRYPLGFGLTYSTLEYTAARLSSDAAPVDGSVTVSVDVKNSGERAASALVHVYTSGGEAVERAPKDLRAFARVDIQAGETETVDIELPVDRVTRYWADGDWQYEAGTYTVHIGPHAGDLPLEVSLLATEPVTE